MAKTVKVADRVLSANDQKVYDQLKSVRASKTVSLKPTPFLRDEIEGLDGKKQPFRLRYYQVQGTYHMLALKRMVLGDDTGTGKCQRGDTLILSSKGLRTLQSFAPATLDRAREGFYDLDEKVSVWTGQQMSPVSRFYWSGKKPTVKVTTRSGYQVECTLVHPLRVRGPEGEEWVHAGLLQEGQFLCVDRSAAPFPMSNPAISFDSSVFAKNAKQYHFPTHVTQDLATLLGYVIAEGNRSPSGVIVTQFEALNPDPHPDPHLEIRDLFFRVFGWHGNYSDTQRDTRIAVASVAIKSFFAACQVDEELSRDKFVPDCILQSTRECVRGFLSAFIEAEGSVGNGGVEVSSASEKLLRVVQVLLLRFGIIGSLVPKRIEGNPHVYWRLTFYGDSARIFQTEIGFRSVRKKALLQNDIPIQSNTNKDVVPHSKDLICGIRLKLAQATAKSGANSVRQGSGIKQFGDGFRTTFDHISYGRRNPSYTWLRELLRISEAQGLGQSEECDAIRKLEAQHFFYDPIVKIEPSEAEVMDLEVGDPAHCYVANGILSHNTAVTIAALCYLFGNDPTAKPIVVTTKSSVLQWASEILRFTKGIRPIVVGEGKEKNESPVDSRARAYKDWAESTEPTVLILNYALLIRDWNHGGFQPPKKDGKLSKEPVKPGLLDGTTLKLDKRTIAIYDEASAFKSDRTKTWEIVRYLSDRVGRAYALTATLLKNDLEEGYNIYKAIRPGTFGTKQDFLDTFCIYKLQDVPGGRKIPVVLSYRNIQLYRDTIDPYFLGRKKHMVSDELPVVVSKEVVCPMQPAEEAKYDEALTGILELGDGEVRDFEENKILVSLIYCQQVVDSLDLLRFKEGSEFSKGMLSEETLKIGALHSKELALVDLLKGELEGEKVIVYTRFEKLVTRLTEILKREGIKSVRITGAESTSAKRQAAQVAFQDLKSDVKVVFITAAGSEAINLQAAMATVFFDLPWSWGDYLQTLGRMVRIGSPHKGVLVYHLLAERMGGKKTIDHHVLATLQKKKKLIDSVLGEAAVGALEFNKEDGVQDLFKLLLGDKRS